MSDEVACPECGGWLVVVVDGRRRSHEELVHLPYAPHSIKRRIVHKTWCTRTRGES